VIAEKNPELAARAAKEIESAGGRALAVETDVTVESSIERAVAAAIARFGAIHVLFNNAGIEIHGPLITTDEAQHRNLMDINVNGVFYGLKYGIQAMLRNAGPARGSIVNTASVAGLLGAPGLGSYNAAKHAVIGLTRNACLEYGMFGIRVNAVCPGVINTPMATALATTPELLDRIGKAHALGRIGEPAEVARAVLFLASDDASYITGAALTVDGGFSVGPSPAAGMTDALGS